MAISASRSYLANDVMTATPQKLQLMRIETAIRSVERGRQQWQEGDDDKAREALIHAQEVVGHLLGSTHRDVDPRLAAKVASVYLVVFRTLMEANYNRDEKKLADALRILKIERKTWREVCKWQGGTPEPQREVAAGISLEA